MFQVRATTDIGDAELRAVVDALRLAGEAEAISSRRMFRSAEPPSWISIAADWSTWQNLLLLGGKWVVGVVLTDIVTDGWRGRAKLLKALKSEANSAILAAAHALARVATSLDSRTELKLTLPFSDDWFGATLTLEGRDWETLATQIVLLAAHMQALNTLLSNERLQDHPEQGPMDLKLLADGSLQVEWMDRRTLEMRTVTFPPPAEA